MGLVTKVTCTAANGTHYNKPKETARVVTVVIHYSMNPREQLQYSMWELKGEELHLL